MTFERGVFAGPSLDVPPIAVAQMLRETAAAHGARPALVTRAGPGAPFNATTWAQVHARVRDLAQGLLALGVAKGDRVAILADTRAEWVLADFAVLSVGAVTVTIFPTLTAEQTLFLLNDSGARLVFVDTQAQYEKLRGMAERAKTVERCVVFDAVEPGQDALARRTMGFEALEASGRALPRDATEELAAREAQVRPEDLATIIYTSGTTGVPKGAMLTHANLVASAHASIQALGLEGTHPRGLAFLPLAHSYQRQNAFVLLRLGGSAAFTTPARLLEDMKAVSPTIITSVPRLYERMFDRIHAEVAKMPARRRWIFARAQAVAKAHAALVASGGRPGPGLRFAHAFFERLVYRRLRARLGFSRLEMAVTGAAAIRPDLLHFFQGIGVNILEGYGLTETTAPSNVNPPGRWRAGTVGPPMPGVEQRLAQDQEILVRGPNVFVGYWERARETQEAFVELDGKRWFCSGDVGAFDEDGYLRIVDRKKELEVLSTGKKVAPLVVEERLKASAFIQDALLVATDRKFAGALIQPDFDPLLQWARAHGVAFEASRVAVDADATGERVTQGVGRDLLDAPEVQALFAREVEVANAHFADFERVRAFTLADHAFTIARDELTPTLKKKRRVIAQHYASQIEEMFASAQAPAKR